MTQTPDSQLDIWVISATDLKLPPNFTPGFYTISATLSSALTDSKSTSSSQSSSLPILLRPNPHGTQSFNPKAHFTFFFSNPSYFNASIDISKLLGTRRVSLGSFKIALNTVVKRSVKDAVFNVFNSDGTKFGDFRVALSCIKLSNVCVVKPELTSVLAEAAKYDRTFNTETANLPKRSKETHGSEKVIAAGKNDKNREDKPKRNLRSPQISISESSDVNSQNNTPPRRTSSLPSNQSSPLPSPMKSSFSSFSAMSDHNSYISHESDHLPHDHSTVDHLSVANLQNSLPPVFPRRDLSTVDKSKQFQINQLTDQPPSKPLSNSPSRLPAEIQMSKSARTRSSDVHHSTPANIVADSRPGHSNDQDSLIPSRYSNEAQASNSGISLTFTPDTNALMGMHPSSVEPGTPATPGATEYGYDTLLRQYDEPSSPTDHESSENYMEDSDIPVEEPDLPKRDSFLDDITTPAKPSASETESAAAPRTWSMSALYQTQVQPPQKPSPSPPIAASQVTKIGQVQSHLTPASAIGERATQRGRSKSPARRNSRESNIQFPTRTLSTSPNVKVPSVLAPSSNAEALSSTGVSDPTFTDFLLPSQANHLRLAAKRVANLRSMYSFSKRQEMRILRSCLKYPELLKRLIDFDFDDRLVIQMAVVIAGEDSKLGKSVEPGEWDEELEEVVWTKRRCEEVLGVNLDVAGRSSFLPDARLPSNLIPRINLLQYEVRLMSGLGWTVEFDNTINDEIDWR